MCLIREGPSTRGSLSRLLQYTVRMPKMKTHSGAKKRFKKTAKGKLRARHSFTSHNLGKKSAKRKRHLGRPVVVAEADRTRVEKLMHK
jgi:large subunit ribosomal protein L35